jgi:uncharacterized membrane protein YhaH (DUF805 family)
VLAGLLGRSAGLVPAARREWAQAVLAEAGEVPAGWGRVAWLSGGLWLVAREAKMVRKFVYWLGAGAVAAGAAWVVWLSWRTSSAADPQTVTDRVRVAVGAAALVVLPWVGRRRGWLGPVGGSITARLVRVAGCAAVCGLGVTVVRMDSHLGLGPHGPGPFSLPREITALVVLGAALAALAVVKARWPDADPDTWWAVSGLAGVLMFVVVPVQALAVIYVAGILAATSRRSPVANASLAAGTIAGLAAGLATTLAVYETAGDDSYAILLLFGMITMLFLLAAIAGAAAAWRLSATGDPQDLRAARVRQGLLAGAVTGAVCGLLLTNFSILAGMVMMVLGPLAGLGGGALGGALAADHPRQARHDHSWAAGLFVLRS